MNLFIVNIEKRLFLKLIKALPLLDNNELMFFNATLTSGTCGITPKQIAALKGATDFISLNCVLSATSIFII